MKTDRGTKAMAQLMCHGQLDLSWRQELSIVLNRYQACVQGGHAAITEGGIL